MTWRRFLVLLRGLSAESALAMSVSDEQNNDELPEMETDEDAEKALYRAIGVNPQEVGD